MSGLLQWHSRLQTPPEPVIVNAQESRGLSDCHSHSINLNMFVVAFVIGLLYPSRPNAIVWTIVSIVIFTLDAVLWRWTRSHISVEGWEVMRPFWADRNSTSAIASVTPYIFIQAALFYLQPYTVFPEWFARNCNRCAMRHLTCANLIALKTSATLCEATAEIAAKYFALLSAIASAQKTCLMIIVRQTV